jgi:hypothetical protein
MSLWWQVRRVAGLLFGEWVGDVTAIAEVRCHWELGSANDSSLTRAESNCSVLIMHCWYMR